MSVDEDRRNKGQRVPFEALVVVASPQGGAGAYECEAVDVSEKGMHLRTAYLPEVGQTLNFRFDGGGGEVVTEGIVQWREEQAKGGEFGVRFAPLDEAGLAALRDICGVDEEKAPADAPKGTRVRLHIDGLGSPMRARVRGGAQSGEVMVGSNLDFLRVGKPLELEDVEQNRKRPATIDRVDVEVDPESHVPQLVVTLRYDDAGPRLTAPRPSSPGPKTVASPSVPAGPEPEHESGEAETPFVSGPSAVARLGERARLFVAELGPRLAKMREGAAGAAGAVAQAARRIRPERQGDAETDARPRRVTAPAPDGALHASGRSVVRGEKDETVDHDDDGTGIEETDEEALRVRRKQRVLIGAGAGVLAVLLLVFTARARSAPPGADAAAASAEVVAAALPPPLPAHNGAPVASGDAITANVPLFGTTPLSTTEPAPLPAPTLAAAPPPVGQPGAATGDEDGADGATAQEGGTQFGKGTVKKARTIRLKMDAPITALKGSVTGNSLTVLLPGRRNVESASTLAKRDKRLTGVKAVPKDGGLEVTFSFKDAPPPFLAKANGKMLEIDLGQNAKDDDDADGATASTDKKHKHKHPTAQKPGDGAGKKKHHGKKKKHKDD